MHSISTESYFADRTTEVQEVTLLRFLNQSSVELRLQPSLASFMRLGHQDEVNAWLQEEDS